MSDSQETFVKPFEIGTKHPLIEDGPFAAFHISSCTLDDILSDRINHHIWETETVKGRLQYT